MNPPNRLVAALVYDGLCTFEFSCAAEVFGLPRPELGPDWYRFETVAVEPGPLRGTYGLEVRADAGLERLADAGTIVIAGWRIEGGDLAPVPDALQSALRAAHARGTRLLSVCSGAGVLAACGLLDDREATTHWKYAEAYRQQFPKVRWRPDVLYTDDGGIITSAGSAAGLDACLHLVRRDFGARIANHVARRLVVPAHRDGGQAQFIERPVPATPRDRLGQALRHMLANLHREHRVAELAAMCAMSERSFLRHFRRRTGLSPVDWLSQARVDRARELLEDPALPIERIAGEAGFGTATNLRHHFRRKLGISPTEYRRRFAGGTDQAA